MSKPTPPPQEPQWRPTLDLAHGLLKRWLALFDASLSEAENSHARLPAPDRLAELKNAFAMTKTLLEIELLAHRLNTLTETTPDDDDFLAHLEKLGPDLLAGHLSSASEDD
ncbi:MAG: hypothetical protein RLY93_12650 [Sumerlaeia bacterium]